MDYISLRDPADYTEPEPPTSAAECRLHELRHERHYWHSDILLCERALTDADHRDLHDEIRSRLERGRIEVERLEFEIQVAELKGEIKTNEATIELHENGLRACNRQIINLLNQLDDVRNERRYRQSDEYKAGLTFNEWNRIQLGLDARKAVAR